MISWMGTLHCRAVLKMRLLGESNIEYLSGSSFCDERRNAVDGGAGGDCN